MTDTNTAQMVADLQSTNSSVRGMGWVSPELGGAGASLGLLGSSLNPLSGLATAGLSWFMPLISFLGDGLTQLQGGNGASVSSGSQDFGQAGQDISGVADSYRQSTTAQTSDWSGAAADEYRDSAAQHADGVEGLGQASTTTSGAIIGAGQVVAQCISEVTELIAEAVSQIVPIMTQAVARAGETNGESIAEAIPPCVAIAVEYALRIASKLAALLASGDNLMKLVQGGMAIVDLIQQAMSTISNQSVQPSLDSAANGGGAGQQQGGGSSTKAADAAQGANAMADWDSSQNAGSSDPASSTSGSGGGSSPSAAGLSTSDIPATPTPAPLDQSTHSSGVTPIPRSHSTVPDASRYASHTASSGAAHGGGMPLTASADRAVSGGARVGAGRGGDTVRQESKKQSSRAATSGSGAPGGGMPMGGMGASRPAGDKDKEHQRKYEIGEEKHEEEFAVVPAVITAEQFKL